MDMLIRDADGFDMLRVQLSFHHVVTVYRRHIAPSARYEDCDQCGHTGLYWYELETDPDKEIDELDVDLCERCLPITEETTIAVVSDGSQQ